ncbi:glycosyltransferase family 2 protein [Thermodesulfobacteriota bacterium]
MKLIIQIPSYNEEKSLPQVVRELPRKIPGIDTIEYLVIDDGSTDGTVEVAEQEGVHHAVNLISNQGCGTAFQIGIGKCIELGADIIVNTDGDNQYPGVCIQDLVMPIIEEKADIVVGTRPIERIDDFSWVKKKLQRLGSYVARQFSGTTIPDVTSGFRAFSADAAKRLNILSAYSHTLETIIQAGHMNMKITHVPVEVNPSTRKSRLMSSLYQYIGHSTFIILRSYIRYKPLRTFIYLSLIPGTAGLAICFRFLYYSLVKQHSGHIQSLILAAILLLIAFHLITLGIIGDLIGTNRSLIQENMYLMKDRIQKQEQEKRQNKSKTKK